MTSELPADLVRISKVAGRYLLFDIKDVMYIRRRYNICSVFVGTIPQNPQQNVFMGLPTELFPEEAKVLVDLNAAYVVDEAQFQSTWLAAPEDSSRRSYLKGLHSHARLAQRAAGEKTQQIKAKHLDKINSTGRSSPKSAPDDADLVTGPDMGLFDSSRTLTRTPVMSRDGQSIASWSVTPTQSGELATPLQEIDSIPWASVEVPVSYPLYAHLQSKGYFMTPGLRFGCDYSVYPGDPLRFHSHFLATSYDWDEEISLMDLVGSGRLATGVKKGYLIGGEIMNADTGETTAISNEGNYLRNVRTFCIEWAGM